MGSSVSVSQALHLHLERTKDYYSCSSCIMTDWNSSLLNCCHDMGTCLCGYFCGCCQMYQNAEDLGENGIICFLASCITPCIPIFMLRNKAREKYGIEGDTVTDALVACCCGCCANIQTANEIRHHGDH